MAWVEPNSVVYALKGVPMDRGFQHTVYWDTLSAQQTYFASKIQRTYSTNTYQRADKGRIRVKDTYANVLPCNYLMFKNTSHENKWFYAFIDAIEYINENTVEIAYTIDPLQTWHFEYELMPCFVEREHAASDVIGENQITEDIEAGDLMCAASFTYGFDNWQELTDPSDVNKLSLVCAYSAAGTGAQNGKILVWNDTQDEYEYLAGTYTVNGTVHSNVVSGLILEHMEFRRNNTTDFTEVMDRFGKFVNKITASPEGLSIAAIWECPYPVYLAGKAGQYGNGTDPIKHPWQLNEPTFFKSAYKTGEDYTDIKNNKMYTYPYQKLTISNNDGKVQDYRWEYFTGTPTGNPDAGFATFDVTASLQPQPCLCIYPTVYRGVLNFYEQGLEFQGFVPVVWSEDSFSRWWAQNKATYVNSLLSSIIKSTAGVGLGLAAPMMGASEGIISNLAMANLGTTGMTGSAVASAMGMQSELGVGIAGGLTSASSDVLSVITKTMGAEATPDTIKGSITAEATRLIQNRQTITAYAYTISAERAKVIDRYFSLYGYACHQIKVPNRNVRQHWCYTKTVNCIVEGDMPNGVNEEIESLYDKGITFWKDPDHLGQYESAYEWDNEVVTP